MEHRDHGISEDAEAAAAIGFGVMPGRAYERINVPDAAFRDRVDRDDHAARREQRDLVATGSERRELAGVSSPGGAERPDPLQVTRGMKAEDLLLRCRPGSERLELP